MKFSMLFVLLVFCASKVHFSLSDKQSWNSRVKNLVQLDNQGKQSVDELHQFYKDEILNYANNVIHNESILLVERMTNVALAKMVHINDRFGSTYDCFGPMQICVDAALSNLQEITQNEINFFEECANNGLSGTKSLRMKLQKVRKIQEEMHLFIRNSTETVSGSCVYITPETAAELCLASRESKVKLFLQYISESVLRYRKTLLRTVSRELISVNGCMSNIYYSIEKKIQDVENKTENCVSGNAGRC